MAEEVRRTRQTTTSTSPHDATNPTLTTVLIEEDADQLAELLATRQQFRDTAQGEPASPRKRRLDEVSDLSYSQEDSFSHDRDRRDALATTTQSSPIIEADSARFPAALLTSQSDTSASSSSGSGNSDLGTGTLATTSILSRRTRRLLPIHPTAQALRFRSDDRMKAKDRVPLNDPAQTGGFRQAGEETSPETLGESTDSAFSNVASRGMELPPAVVRQIIRHLISDVVHSIIPRLPESVVQRGSEIMRRYSFFVQLRWLSNYRLVNKLWHDTLDAQPLFDDNSTRTWLPAPLIPIGLPSISPVRDLRLKCIPCVLNNHNGDVFARRAPHTVADNRLFGRMNICWIHARNWPTATQSDPQLLVCHVCLMGGHRTGSSTFLAGNILANDDAETEDFALNICESCRISDFFDHWAQYPVRLSRRFRLAVKDTKAYSLYTRHGHGSAAAAVSDAHDELEELSDAQQQTCQCSICQRQKRLNQSSWER